MQPSVRSFPFPFVIALTCVVLAATNAQSPPQIRAAHDASASIAGSYGLALVDGQLIGGGHGYAVRFDRGSIEVTPALGERAPRDLPVLLTMESIRRGATTICVGGSVEPTHESHDARVTYIRDANVEERYDVRPAGVEQSFIFAERSPGRGDLVVRLRVDTELRADPGVDLDSLELTIPDVGGVSIGAVTGVDADGCRVAGTMGFDGTHLELVLPDAFVERAAYPLVLDPLIGGITSAGASFDDYEPDVAYDETNDVYLVVWEFKSSMVRSQIWGQRLNGDGTRRGGIVFVANGPGLQKNPAVANVAVADQFAVVWQDDGFGSWDILGRGVVAMDGSMTSVVTVAGTAADEITPDAGGDATGPDDEALIVWKKANSDLEAVQLELQPGQTPTVIGSVVTVDTAPQTANPAIAKSGGQGNRYLIVWETSMASNWFIGYAAFDRDLNVLTPTFMTGGTGGPLVHPDVDGDGTRWMVVYQTMETRSSTLGDIEFVEPEYDSNGSFRILAVGTIEADPSNDEVEPDVVFAGTLYVVAWSDQQPGQSSDYRIKLTQMVPGLGSACGLRYVTGRTPVVHNAKPVVCSQFTGGGNPDQAMLCWEHGDLSNGNSLVMRQRFDSFGGGSVVTIHPGCQGGGTATADGPLAIGNPHFKLKLSGAGPNATATVLAAGFRTAPPIPCGPCRFVAALATAAAPIAGGSAEFPLPVPCDANLIGAQLAAQWWTLAPGSNACPTLPGIGASNILGMTIAD